MPAPKPTPLELPSDDLILAAIERAVCHQGHDERAESLRAIKEHLDLPHTGWTTLQLRPKLEALETVGLVQRSRRRGTTVWGLTAKGQRRLTAVRRELTLPEAPQHRKWREAQALAGERIDGFRRDLGDALVEAAAQLEAEGAAPSSATWFALAESVQRAAWLLGSATYCLSEWAEPEDSSADTDEAPHGQVGRRNAREWDRS
jgi:hypothetical protein